MRADLPTAGLLISDGRVGARPSRMLVVVVAWGLCFPLIAWGIRDAPVLWFAALRTLGGLIIVAAPSGGDGRGAGLALLAALGIAVGALLARRLSSIDLPALGAWQFLLGGTVLAAIAWAVDRPPTTIAWSSRFALTLAVLALAATALPYLLCFGELRRASLTAVTAWTLLVPLACVIGDVIVVAGLAVVAHPTGPSAPETPSAGNTVE